MPVLDQLKPVLGFDGYFASKDGEIYSSKSGKLVKLKARAGRDGYLLVVFSVKKKQTTRKVHRLVLESFVGPRPDGMVARHLDGNKLNNRLSNLVWGTQKENIHDKFLHGTTPIGSDVYNSVFTDEKLKELKLSFCSGAETITDIAKRINVSKGVLWGAITGRRYCNHSPELSALVREKISKMTPKKRNLTNEDYSAIVKMHADGFSKSFIAKKLGFHPSYISRLISGDRNAPRA